MLSVNKKELMQTDECTQRLHIICHDVRIPLEARSFHLIFHDTTIKNLIIRPTASFIRDETCLLCGPRRSYQRRHVLQTGISFPYSYLPLIFNTFPCLQTIFTRRTSGHCIEIFRVVKHCLLLINVVTLVPSHHFLSSNILLYSSYTLD